MASSGIARGDRAAVRARPAIRWLAGVALVSIIGCRSAPEARARGQAIPLGAYTVTVNHSALRELGGTTNVAVYLSIAEFTPTTDAAKLWLAKLNLGIRLRGGQGHTSRGVLIPARQFELIDLRPEDLRSYGGSRMLEDSLFAQGDPTQWVAMFPVPRQAQGFALLMANPDRKAGQPASVEVDLGR